MNNTATIWLIVIVGFGFWHLEDIQKQIADTDKQINEQIQISNQKQCVKDAKESDPNGILGKRFSDGVALSGLGTLWDSSEALAAYQSNIPVELGGDWIREGQSFFSENIKVGLAGYDIAHLMVPWAISAANAGADRCGRQAEVDNIRKELSPWTAPVERRSSIKGHAMELVDDMGGRDKLSASERAVSDKILGPDYGKPAALDQPRNPPISNGTVYTIGDAKGYNDLPHGARYRTKGSDVVQQKP
jgi:hypothetical protein